MVAMNVQKRALALPSRPGRHALGHIGTIFVIVISRARHDSRVLAPRLLAAMTGKTASKLGMAAWHPRAPGSIMNAWIFPLPCRLQSRIDLSDRSRSLTVELGHLGAQAINVIANRIIIFAIFLDVTKHIGNFIMNAISSLIEAPISAGYRTITVLIRRPFGMLRRRRGDDALVILIRQCVGLIFLLGRNPFQPERICC